MYPGPCITTALPGEVCVLEATSTMCESFNATTCVCAEGYEHREMMCIGKKVSVSKYIRGQASLAKDNLREGQSKSII